MNPILLERAGESTSLRNGTRTSDYLPLGAASQTYGTRYFLASAVIASIIPLIQLIIGSYYQGECRIDQRIPTYMIISGVCGLILAALSVFAAISFLCFIPDSTGLSLIATCGLCLNLVLTVIISIFLFIWFILGCVWVFSVHNKVQYIHPTQSNYCQPILYKATFALLIMTIIWFFLQCCLSCLRSCCTGRNQ